MNSSTTTIWVIFSGILWMGFLGSSDIEGLYLTLAFDLIGLFFFFLEWKGEDVSVRPSWGKSMKRNFAIFLLTFLIKNYIFWLFLLKD